jgi:hypothetical protein
VPLSSLLSKVCPASFSQGNCDAEGRLILADALYEAASSGARPDLVVDAATLTGAARAALGPELPAVFSDDEEAWRQLEAAAAAQVVGTDLVVWGKHVIGGRLSMAGKQGNTWPSRCA